MVGFLRLFTDRLIIRAYINEGWQSHPQALKKLIRFAFSATNAFRLSTSYLAENKGSEMVMKKCRMIKESELKAHAFHNGDTKDRIECRI